MIWGGRGVKYSRPPEKDGSHTPPANIENAFEVGRPYVLNFNSQKSSNFL